MWIERIVVLKEGIECLRKLMKTKGNPDQQLRKVKGLLSLANIQRVDPYFILIEHFYRVHIYLMVTADL